MQKIAIVTDSNSGITQAQIHTLKSYVASGMLTQEELTGILDALGV